MLVKLIECVKFLLLQHASLFLETNVTELWKNVPDVPVVVLLKVLFEEGNWGEFLVIFAGLAIDLDEALILSEFFEGFLSLKVWKEDVTVDFIWDNLFFNGSKRLKLGHYDHLFAGGL